MLFLQKRKWMKDKSVRGAFSLALCFMSTDSLKSLRYGLHGSEKKTFAVIIQRQFSGCLVREVFTFKYSLR